MKEAIANAGIFNLVIIFVIVLLAFFIGSLGYSKAFKVKDRIIEEIEKERGYTEVARKNIEDFLISVGYRISSGNNNCGEETFSRNKGILQNTNSKYQYCVYKFDTCSGKKCSVHYRVVSYMYFDVPDNLCGNKSPRNIEICSLNQNNSFSANIISDFATFSSQSISNFTFSAKLPIAFPISSLVNLLSIVILL